MSPDFQDTIDALAPCINYANNMMYAYYFLEPDPFMEMDIV